jgi:hypothetical protein
VREALGTSSALVANATGKLGEFAQWNQARIRRQTA